MTETKRVHIIHYEELAEAVISHAAEEYRLSVEYGYKNGIIRGREFFRSELFTILCLGKIDGEYIIKKIEGGDLV